MRPSIVHARGPLVTRWLACFLHYKGMTSLTATFRNLPAFRSLSLEDRIDRLSRWALILLLLATLACLV